MISKNTISIAAVVLLFGCQSNPKPQPQPDPSPSEAENRDSTAEPERALPRVTPRVRRPAKSRRSRFGGRRADADLPNKASTKVVSASSQSSDSSKPASILKPLGKPRRSISTGTVLESTRSSRDDPNWLYALGRAAYLRKNHEKALQLLSKAIDASPNVGEYFFRRALCHASIEHDQKAAEDYRRAVQLNPKYQEDLRLADELAEIYRARALTSIGKGKESSVVLVHFKRAAKLNPLSKDLDDIPETLLDRIRQDAIKRRNSRAIADARFVRENFEDTISLETVVDVYVKRGEKAMSNQIYSTAKKEFEFAMAIAPDLQRIMDYIFECERLLQDPDTQRSAKKYDGAVEDLVDVDINPINYSRFVESLEKLQRERARMKKKPVVEQKRILKLTGDLETRIWRASLTAADEAFRNDKVEEAHSHVQIALRMAPAEKRKQTASRKQIISTEFATQLVDNAKKLSPKRWRKAKELVEQALSVSSDFRPAKDWLAARRARLSEREDDLDSEESSIEQFVFFGVIGLVVIGIVYMLFGGLFKGSSGAETAAGHPGSPLISGADGQMSDPRGDFVPPGLD